MKSPFAVSLWDSKTLLVLLAAGQGANLIYASVVFDGHINIVNPLFWFAVLKGLVLGIGVSFSASYAGYQLPRVKKIVAQKIGWWSLGATVGCSAVVVAICGVESPLGWERWMVGGCYAVMVESSVMAVAMASGKMFNDSQDEASKSEAVAKEKPAKPAPAVALPAITPLPVAVSVVCKYGCGYERATQQAINAHYRGCKKNPANMPVRVDLGV